MLDIKNLLLIRVVLLGLFVTLIPNIQINADSQQRIAKKGYIVQLFDGGVGITFGNDNKGDVDIKIPANIDPNTTKIFCFKIQSEKRDFLVINDSLGKKILYPNGDIISYFGGFEQKFSNLKNWNYNPETKLIIDDVEIPHVFMIEIIKDIVLIYQTITELYLIYKQAN